MVLGVENTEQHQPDRKKPGSKKLNLLSWIHRIAPARLTSRIILINVTGLIILVAGILYFNQTRKGLIAVRSESLMTQAQIMAAAVASAAAVNTDSIIINPDLLIEQQLGAKNPAGSSPFQSFEFPINPELAGRVLRRLVSSSGTRARIFDRDGQMVVDSRHFYGRGEILRFDLPPINAPEQSFLTTMWTRWNAWIFANNYPLQKPYGLDNGKEFSEVRLALTGLPITRKMVNDKNEIIVIVAVPIQQFRAVQGVLILTTRGGEIDDVLKKERKVVFLTFGVAVLVALLLSLSLAGHIGEPIRRLSAAAERIRRGVNNRVEIPDFTFRRDEVGQLSGSLRDMTESLYKRIDAIESFAADVAHELKNPLTSLRSAVETLGVAKTPEQRHRMIEIVTDDVKRLDRLITDISDASRLDAELVRTKSKTVDMERLLITLVDLHQEMASKINVTLVYKTEKTNSHDASQTTFSIIGHDNRLGQVVANLLSNAISFSPADTKIEVILRRKGEMVEFVISDSGPGIPPQNLEKIFHRFYTDRPASAFGKNSGLGLSISRQIIEAYKGTIIAKNREVGLGAQFIVQIPATSNSKTSRKKTNV